MNSNPLNSSNSDKLSFQDNIQKLFEKLYKRTAAKIISSLIKKGANKSDAEDSYHEALKEMLLKFYSQSLTLEIEDAEKYLRTVAKNNLIAKLKLQGKYLKIDGNTEKIQNVFLEENDFSKTLIAKKMMSLLSEKCKEILTERLINSKKHLEIAKALFITEESAKKQYQRCLSELRKTSDYEKLKKIYYEN
jgi:DNA-directed RNA polymerase specialized sigma24 family protein